MTLINSQELGTTELDIKLAATVDPLLLSGPIQATLDLPIRDLTWKMRPDAVCNLFSSFHIQHEFSLSSIVRRSELD